MNINTQTDATVVKDIITEICSKFGPRPPGSVAEQHAAQFVREKFEPMADEIIYDEFEIHPGLYPNGGIIIFASSVLIGLIFMFFSWPWPLITIILPLLGAIQIFWTLLGMRETFAFLFKKARSQNVLAKIKPRNSTGQINPTKNKVIIAGHIDSANEMRIAKYGDNIKKVTLSVFIYIIAAILCAIVKLIWLALAPNQILIATNGVLVFTYIDLVFLILSVVGLPLVIMVMRGYIIGTPVMGANDNLGGVGIAYAIAKYFTQTDHRLQHLELWVGGFGSEECGERGSHDFVLKYGKQGELNNAYGMIPESCVAGTDLAVVTAEPFHFVKHHPDAYNRLFTGYTQYLVEHKEEPKEDLIPCALKLLPVAASDAGRFSLAGFKGTMLLGFEGKLMKPKNWHSPADIPENIDTKITQVAFEIFRNFLVQFDAELDASK